MKWWTIRRKTNSLCLIILFWGAIGLFGQDRPSPPSNVIGPQLIAWSVLQKPQPVLEPVPEPNRPRFAQDQQEANSTGQQHEPSAQSFGSIGKDGSGYVLKVSDGSAYALDDQERARQFEGKQVRVSGTLNPNDKSLQVLNIELLSR